jgi:hypothetical protein
VGDITEEGSVMTGRPEMMTPTEDMFDASGAQYSGLHVRDVLEMAVRLQAERK